MMARQGGDKPAARERRRSAPGSDVKKQRIGPRAYLGEVVAELKKVAWPTRREVINSTIVVLIAVVFMTSLIFLLDYMSSNLVLTLFD
jgi:preprotein translocase subunit SecE